MGNQISQIFPPAAAFTEASLPNLKGKVYIVTGASAGVGKELAGLLYSRNGTVYAAARSADKTNAAMRWIKEKYPNSEGVLHYLHLDLNDLEGVKPSAETFLARESRLDVLFNNAGVMTPPQGSRTKQDYELQLGTNCVAPFLFTKILIPTLINTAKREPKGAVRVIWTSSSAAHLASPKGGVDMSNLDYKVEKGAMQKYAISKAGNVMHAREFARRYNDHGIASMPLNPGNLRSDLQRHNTALQMFFMNFTLYPPVNGAYTELFAGLSPDAANIKTSQWVIPWGRITDLRKDLYSGPGEDNARLFWEWSEEQVAPYA